MQLYLFRTPRLALVGATGTLLLTACVGTSIDQWTDHDRHLNDADMVNLRFRYALCEKASWDVGVRQADLYTGSVSIVTVEDVVLGSTIPGYWTSKGTWFFGRGFARGVIVANERPAAFTRCMRNHGWWHEDELISTVR